MIVDVRREDNFNDIVRKAARGTGVSGDALARATGLERHRLALLLGDGAVPTPDEATAIAKALGLDPAKLRGIGIEDWSPRRAEPPDFVRHQVNHPHESNGYVLVDAQRHTAAIVDPGGNAGNLAAIVQGESARAELILLTHKHPDHVDALDAVRRTFPDAHVYIHDADRAALGTAADGAQAAEDGAHIPFGSDTVTVLHTPGHTDGSVCFLYRDALLTGDTLFAGSVGGCFGDAFGYDDLLADIKRKILRLPARTVLLPGHGPPSTVAQELEHNPFF